MDVKITATFFLFSILISTSIASGNNFWKVYDVIQQEYIDLGGSNSSVSLPQFASGRIAYGNLATLGQFPWIGRMIWYYPTYIELNCAGTVIAPNYFLTAAHCVFNDQLVLNPPTNVWINGINTQSSQNFAENIQVEQAFVPAEYVPGMATSSYDLAILKLKTPSSVNPVTLAQTPPPAGTGIYAIGWGITDFSPQSTVDNLYFTNMTVGAWGTQPCPGRCGQFPTCTTECEVGTPQPNGMFSSSCPGDSGGPQVLQSDTNTQVSITSYGPSGLCGSYPWGVGTLIPTVLPYINQIVSGNVSTVNPTPVVPSPVLPPSPALTPPTTNPGNSSCTLNTSRGVIVSVLMTSTDCTEDYAISVGDVAGQFIGSQSFCIVNTSYVGGFGSCIVKAQLAVSGTPAASRRNIIVGMRSGAFSNTFYTDMPNFTGTLRRGGVCIYPNRHCRL